MEKPLDGERRREEIIRLLAGSRSPVSGTELARRLKVSRQVIVQDVALLRAVNKNILSTNKGYIFFDGAQEENRKKRTYKVKHKDEEILDELFVIVDMGGKIRDVVVEHGIYGQISADLIINCRADAEAFVKKVEKYKTKPLNNLTHGIHFHTVEADSEEALDRIGEELERKGYLIR